MAPTVEIAIPNTTLSNTSPPYALYHITLRLPLRSFTVPKRYSDFATFHNTLISQTNALPPAPLPSKNWFSKTASNDRLREDRRRGLEEYLRAINESEDGRWRTSPAWRAFLNLPTAVTSAGTRDINTSARLHAAITDPAATNAPITDPTLWLDYYRDMKNHLHDARLQLSRRDQETTPQKQHESSAQAKGSLTRAGTMITTLDDGLKNLGRGEQSSQSQSSSILGEGEIRRRKDLLINARKEKDGLEDLLHAMATKSRLNHTVASVQDKGALINAGNAAGDVSSGRKTPARAGRVLGKETERTRELDNEGVLQLQRQMMQSQDDNVDELRKIIFRQRELGTQINDELEVQSDLLRLADEEADILKSKIDVGRKRIEKIS
ncbi:SNARE complex subunit (Vam7), putative [Penicillium digitatum]|uniref:SNARE complex subunit (Vam7), putative n=3 Tax=Penicillium digitatum TaxID=36651 RepID=K9FHQ6_PEND2|nr:SNARE complex subunit (Vam7), putative [Penicillium digitatum Pd1]EKV06954.1 SNARE complex subunit (Vam7), putative [Penicillium digitatum Pd1]EKV08764.1 SNARE complex subunit (Vam7), putative [Penicillium digitatum PHI26]QQK41039.1 SNARE complex subunit (Vam7), putative [Penicillium digitatum]